MAAGRDIHCTHYRAQVFSHLHPMDLLNLARACKEFRQFFMNKRKSQTLWRAARGNVEGLPECPERLSEPAYAALVFDPYCHVRIDTRLL